MGIEVNTKQVEWVEGETITKLLERMNYTFPLVVVKIDGRVVPTADYETEIVPDNSKIEVIHLISGG